MAITGSNIAERARRILQDTTAGGTRWLDNELLDWINDAQREIVLLKPNAYSSVEDISLNSGTKQEIPSAGLLLLSVVRNSNGRAIRRVDRDILDSENPDWHTASSSSTVEHYVFDEDSPTTFWVYPPNTGGSAVEAILAKAPSDLNSLGDSLVLNDVYANVVLDFVLYRAYSKDTDYAGNSQRANVHYTAFNASLGVRVQAESASSPNLNVSTGRAAGSN